MDKDTSKGLWKTELKDVYVGAKKLEIHVYVRAAKISKKYVL